MNNTDQLLKWKKEIETAKSTLAELTGKESMLMEQLKKDFGCKTIDAAEKKVTEMETAIWKLKTQIDRGVENLQTEFDEINQ